MRLLGVQFRRSTEIKTAVGDTFHFATLSSPTTIWDIHLSRAFLVPTIKAIFHRK